MNFTDKVCAMTATELIMAMVSGLRNKHINLDMSIVAQIRDQKKYGDATTSTTIEILGYDPFNWDKITDKTQRKWAIYSSGCTSKDDWFYENYENAINLLRSGNIVQYNDRARIVGMPEIPLPLKKGVIAEYLWNVQEYQLRLWEKLAYSLIETKKPVK